MSFVKINEAYTQRRSAIEQLKALDADIGDQEPTEEQRTQLDTINTDIDRLDAEVMRWIREGQLEDRSQFLDELMGRGSDLSDEERDGLTAVEKEARGLFVPHGAEGSQRQHEFAGTPADIGRVMRRDLLAGTATDGAELVPTTLFGELYSQLREGATSMFSLGRPIVTMAGEEMSFPKTTAFSTASLISEAGAILESDPQFDTIALNAYKYGLAVQVSYELEADNAVAGALPWVVSQAVDGIRRGVGAHLISGDGSDKPNGVVNGSNTTTVAGIVGPTSDALISCMYDITEGYRMNGVWLFNDQTVKGIRLLKDSDGQYLWQAGLQAGQPDTLLAKRIHTDANIAEAGANAKLGVFGDLKRGYLVRTIASIRAERSDQYAWLNDLITWRMIGRFDGDILDDNAFTVLTNEAS